MANRDPHKGSKGRMGGISDLKKKKTTPKKKKKTTAPKTKASGRPHPNPRPQRPQPRLGGVPGGVSDFKNPISVGNMIKDTATGVWTAAKDIAVGKDPFKKKAPKKK